MDQVTKKLMEIKKEADEENEKLKQYLDLRKVLEKEDLFTYKAYVENGVVVITIYTFEIPLKQVKVDLKEIGSEETIKLIKQLENDAT